MIRIIDDLSFSYDEKNYCDVSEILRNLFPPGDAQQLTAQYVKYRRLALGLSRRKLAETFRKVRSPVSNGPVRSPFAGSWSFGQPWTTLIV